MRYEVEDLKEEMELDKEEIRPRKKEGFFKRHAFLMGMLFCFFCIILACGFIYRIFSI